MTEKATERLSGSQEPGAPPVGRRLDHFAARGPTVHPFLHSVLAPDKKEADVGWLAEKEEDLLTGIGAAVYDLCGEVGPTRERRVPLSRNGWIRRLLSHVHRRGPVDRPSLVMAAFLQQTAKKIGGTLPAVGTLARVPGSSDRNGIIGKNMTTWRPDSEKIPASPPMRIEIVSGVAPAQ